MAKKDKVVDLKPKTEKITEEQLKSLQNVVSAINKLHFDIGTIEAQKHNLLHNLFQANEMMRETQDNFIKEYGTADINIQDGTINHKDEQTDKKN
tara:strand:+ start:2128 stop:2412 length:285 start_codon:yes stop_codon:yes gene_type:complete